VPAERFEAGVERIVQTYLGASRPAVIGAKQLLRQATGDLWQQLYASSLPLLEACLASPDVARTRAARRAR
jgi:hypothetical protein